MAEPTARLAPAPRLGRSLRDAAVDLYFNSWRLVPANLAWTAILVTVLVIGASLSALALLLVPLLALPTVGIYRMAALIVRGEPVALSDGFAAWRHLGGPALLVGCALLALGAMFSFNIALGLLRADIAGWTLATLAGWGLVALALAACVVWPLLVDPRREALPARTRVRLALLLVLAHPIRVGLLAVVLGLLLAVSTVATPALMTISVAYVALVATRYVLPAADRLEARLEGNSG